MSNGIEKEEKIAKEKRCKRVVMRKQCKKNQHLSSKMSMY